MVQKIYTILYILFIKCFQIHYIVHIFSGKQSLKEQIITIQVVFSIRFTLTDFLSSEDGCRAFCLPQGLCKNSSQLKLQQSQPRSLFRSLCIFPSLFLLHNPSLYFKHRHIHTLTRKLNREAMFLSTHRPVFPIALQFCKV